MRSWAQGFGRLVALVGLCQFALFGSGLANDAGVTFTVFARSLSFDFGALSSGRSAGAVLASCGAASRVTYEAFLRQNLAECEFGPTAADPWPAGTSQAVVAGAPALASDSLVRIVAAGPWLLTVSLGAPLPPGLRVGVLARSGSGEARLVSLAGLGGQTLWIGSGSLDLGLTQTVMVSRAANGDLLSVVNARVRLELSAR